MHYREFPCMLLHIIIMVLAFIIIVEMLKFIIIVEMLNFLVQTQHCLFGYKLNYIKSVPQSRSGQLCSIIIHHLAVKEASMVGKLS